MWVAVLQQQRCVGFPVVFEPVECVELDGDDGGVADEFGDHATGINGVELAVSVDQHRSPLFRLCDPGVVVEESGVDHSAFVDDHHGACR